MKTLNPYILLVIKWLNDEDSVTEKELDAADADAYAAAYAADAYAYAYAADADAYAYAYAADADAYAAAYAADAAYAYAYAYAADAYAYAYAADAYAAAYAADAAAAEHHINRYFELTGENKQDYIDAIKPVTVPTFTQAMADAGELPSVGMECLAKRTFESDDLWRPCFIIGKDRAGSYLVFECGDILEQTHIDNGVYSFKPLTPPIELIDGKAYQFTCHSGDEVVGIYSTVHISFDNYGRKFYESNIANIQPLTLEVTK